MKFDPSPTAIWKKYERDRDYKRSIGLYDRVRRNEAFYLGRNGAVDGARTRDLHLGKVALYQRQGRRGLQL